MPRIEFKFQAFMHYSYLDIEILDKLCYTFYYNNYSYLFFLYFFFLLYHFWLNPQMLNSFEQKYLLIFLRGDKQVTEFSHTGVCLYMGNILQLFMLNYFVKCRASCRQRAYSWSCIICFYNYVSRYRKQLWK